MHFLDPAGSSEGNIAPRGVSEMGNRSVVVSGSLGHFAQYQILTTDEEICEYFRLSLNEGGSDAGITNKQILKVVDEINDPNTSAEDLDVLRCEELERLQNVDA